MLSVKGDSCMHSEDEGEIRSTNYTIWKWVQPSTKGLACRGSVWGCGNRPEKVGDAVPMNQQISFDSRDFLFSRRACTVHPRFVLLINIFTFRLHDERY